MLDSFMHIGVLVPQYPLNLEGYPFHAIRFSYMSPEKKTQKVQKGATAEPNTVAEQHVELSPIGKCSHGAARPRSPQVSLGFRL